MGKGNHRKGYEGARWRPGQSGNPAGVPRLPPEMKAISKLTPSYVKAIIAKLSRMSRDELMSYLESGQVPTLELAVASILMKSVADGDPTRLNFLLDRSVGKVVEERRVQIQPVVYRTTVRADGALLQEVIQEELAGDAEEEPAGEDEEPGEPGGGS